MEKGISDIPKDIFGPEYVLRVYDPKIGMEGFLVVDNTVLGPGKGGIRMTLNVSVEEVWRLARTMTWKNALAGIPFGGAKAGIVWKGGSRAEKKAAVQSFARAIAPLIPKKYIAGPDVNTGEEEMRWFAEAVGNWQSATGKPANFCVTWRKGGKKCGLPHELGSTGFGVAQAAAVAVKAIGLELKIATAAIHGFGNVGTFTYKYLTEMGVRVVALADRSGAVFSENGFDEKIIEKFIKDNKPLVGYPGAEKIAPEKFFGLPVDILIPASVTDVINASNKNSVCAKLIIEAANIPMRESIEKELFNRGIMIVPDFVANAGGVISSYAEYRGFSPKKMFGLVREKIQQTADSVLKESLKRRLNPREVALAMAKARVFGGTKKI